MIAALARWLGIVTRMSSRAWTRPALFDSWLAALVTVASATIWFSHAGGLISRDDSYLAGLSIHLATGIALAWRRNSPWRSAVLVAALSVLNPSIASLFGAYAAAAYLSSRRAFGIVTVLVLAVIPWQNLNAWNLTGAISLALVPALTGLWVSSRRGLAEVRAERQEREQELFAERVRRDERDRIAGEMHDVVTHRVSLMVLQAGALLARAPDESVRVAADELRVVGVKALEELRDLVGILHAEDQIGSAAVRDLSTSPAPLEVGELIEQSRTAGVEVELAIEEPARRVPALVGRTGYRVVQEALTNVHKHAPGARVSVRISSVGERTRIVVRNSPPTRPAELAQGAGGTGLAGLRQRVELTGGTIRAEPLPDGGFEVQVVLG